MASRVPAASGPGALGGLLVTISNPAMAATGTYDQPVHVDSAAFADRINSNWSNGAAYYALNGTPVNFWIESNATNLSSDTLLWLRLFSIPGESEVTIALEFASKSTTLLSEVGYSGESPLLSPVYGQYDNGQRVFNFYDSFEGTTLSSQWAFSPPEWSYTVHNGFTLSRANAAGSAIESGDHFPLPAVVDFLGDLSGPKNPSVADVEGLGSSACTSCNSASAVGWQAGSAGSAGALPYVGASSNSLDGTTPVRTTGFDLFTAEEISSTSSSFALNYGTAQSLSGGVPTASLPVGLAISGSGTGAVPQNETTLWIRERTPSPAVVASVAALPAPAIHLVALPGTLSVNSSLTLAATVADWTPVTYSYLGLPPGCSSENASSLSCRVTTPGNYEPEVVATDVFGNLAVGLANVTVLPVSSPVPPLYVTVHLSPNPVAVNSTVTILANVLGGGGALTFAYSGLPTGCHSVNDSVVLCAPSAPGLYSVVVNVTDSVGQAADGFAPLLVTPAPALAAPPLTVALAPIGGDRFVGAPLMIAAEVSGGLPPYHYGYSGLPTGCASADVGAMSCLPSVVGAYTLSVSVRDAAGTEANASTAAVIIAAPSPTSPTTAVGLAPSDAALLMSLIVVTTVAVVVALAAAVSAVRAGRSSRPPSLSPSRSEPAKK